MLGEKDVCTELRRNSTLDARLIELEHFSNFSQALSGIYKNIKLLDYDLAEMYVIYV